MTDNNKKIMKEFDEKGGNWLIHDEVRGQGKGKKFETREKIIYKFFESFLSESLDRMRNEVIQEIMDKTIVTGHHKNGDCVDANKLTELLKSLKKNHE